MKAPDGVQTTNTNSLRGQVLYTQVGTQSGATPLTPTTNVYDTSDRLTSTTDPNGSTTSTTYDAWGEQATVTTPSGATSPTSLTGASETSTMTYYRTGALDTVTDPASNVTTYSIDGENRVTQVDAPGPSGTNVDWQYVYDAAGQMVRMTEPNGNIHDSVFNGLGQQTATYQYPFGTGSAPNETQYSYDDDDGELASLTPPGSGAAIQCYTYDDFGAQTSRYTVPSASLCSTGTQSDVETFTSSPISGMTSAAEGSSGPTVSIAYNTGDPTLVDSVTEGTGISTSYTYTAATEKLASTTHSRGTGTATTINYGYDSTTGRINSVGDPFSTSATTYSYNAGGQVTARSDPSGLTTGYTYDTANRLVSLSAAPTGGGASVLNFGVSYNNLGQESALSQTYPTVSGSGGNATGAWAYTYTPAGELKTSAYTPSGGSAQPTTTYGYDGAGNRTSVQIGSGTPVTSTYDQADRLATVGSTSYTWTPQNQLWTVGSSKTFLYDAWGRVTSATISGTAVTYAYDALNRTMSSTTAGTTTSFIYDGTSQNPVTQTIGSGTPTDYAQGLMGVLGQRVSLTKRYYQQDPHGNLALIDDASATAKGTISYDPWGNQTAVGADAHLEPARLPVPTTRPSHRPHRHGNPPLRPLPRPVHDPGHGHRHATGSALPKSIHLRSGLTGVGNRSNGPKRLPRRVVPP